MKIIKELLNTIDLKFMAFAVLISLILTISIAIQALAQENTLQQRVANEIIRFHVVANSNDSNDQLLKMLVKEEVLNKIAPILYGTNNIDEIKKILKQNLNFIEEVASNIVSQYGNYNVSSSLSLVKFPTITYGDMTLPKGYYNALQITIGNGVGYNWWCVMFPMLCFIEGSTTPTQEMEELFEDILTEEEFKEVFNIRFKTLDWIIGE